MLYPHPLTNSQGNSFLQYGCPQPSQCCISWSVVGVALFHGLNHFHYFLWEYLKSLVFETPVEMDMELVTRIVAACDTIKTYMVRQNIVRRCHAYLLKLDSRIPGSLPQFVQWSILYVLFNFCTLLLNHSVYTRNTIRAPHIPVTSFYFRDSTV